MALGIWGHSVRFFKVFVPSDLIRGGEGLVTTVTPSDGGDFVGNERVRRKGATERAHRTSGGQSRQ
jgi:hypothetical protein